MNCVQMYASETHDEDQPISEDSDVCIQLLSVSIRLSVKIVMFVFSYFQ